MSFVEDQSYYSDQSRKFNSWAAAWAAAMGIRLNDVGDPNDTTPGASTLSARVAAIEDDSYIPASEKGIADGVAELDATGKVPSAQLPGTVDEIIEYANLAAFPGTGASDTLYVTLDTGKVYRWSGTAYTEISASLALGETSATAYRGDRGKTAYDHTSNTSNPHSVTKSQVGLGNVDNTADASKTFAASAITSGTMATARLGSGTASATTYLRGDQSYAVPWSALESRTAVTAGMGYLYFDDFAGADDDAKLDAVLTYIDGKNAEGTGTTIYGPATILFGNRVYVFTKYDRQPRHNMRFAGMLQLGEAADSSGSRVGTRIRLALVTAHSGGGSAGSPASPRAWFRHATGGQIEHIMFSDMAFVGSSGSYIFSSDTSADEYLLLTMRDITTSGLASVLGSQVSGGTNGPVYGQAIRLIGGGWNINNCYNGAIYVAGSDCALFTEGGLIDSSTTFRAAGASGTHYHVRCSNLSKSVMGPVYITAESGWGGLWESGSAYDGASVHSTNAGGLTMFGSRIEGRNGLDPCDGPLIYQTGGHVKMIGGWLGQANGNTVAYPFTGGSRSSNVVTLTGLPSSHGLIVGESITVDAADNTYDGTFTITAVTSTTATYNQTAADDASAGAGTLTGTAWPAADPSTVLGAWHQTAGLAEMVGVSYQMSSYQTAANSPMGYCAGGTMRVSQIAKSDQYSAFGVGVVPNIDTAGSGSVICNDYSVTVNDLQPAVNGMMFGTGTPEGVRTAPIGTLYRRTDGGSGTTLYVKESGTGDTGWSDVA